MSDTGRRVLAGVLTILAIALMIGFVLASIVYGWPLLLLGAGSVLIIGTYLAKELFRMIYEAIRN